MLFGFRLAAVLLISLLSACASPARQVQAIAWHYGMQQSVIEGSGYRHLVYAKGDVVNTESLHIYIEGDGRPWIFGREISRDPTSNSPLALHLMARDSQPAIYLGRPCYFQMNTDPGCDSDMWTFGRYSPIVVDSMAAAINTFLANSHIQNIVLLGHSGGGALAVLLADKVPRVSKVITIAANLDTDGWAALHRYTPLYNSLNPLHAAELGGIAHLHYSGERDSNTPQALIRRFAQTHQGVFSPVADFQHQCCWRASWPELLQRALLILESPLK